MRKEDHWSYWLSVTLCADSGCLNCYLKVAWCLATWVLDGGGEMRRTPSTGDVADMLIGIIDKEGGVEMYRVGDLYGAAESYIQTRWANSN